MAQDWLLEYRYGKQAVMLALHRSDVGDLNRRARSQLRGQRRSRRTGNRSSTTSSSPWATGSSPCVTGGASVCSTALTATVRGRAGKDIVVETDEGARVQVPLEYLLEGHLIHAYAMTIHKSQGMTCDVALVLGDDALHAEAGYTAMTRARTAQSSLCRRLGGARRCSGGSSGARWSGTTAKTTAHDHLSVAR